MFSSVLIANRGEIAVRIARTAKRLGMRVIAVYSEADADALHVRVADEAHLIGPPPARESYLAIDKIIEAASQARRGLHPSGLRLPVGECRTSPKPAPRPASCSSARRRRAIRAMGLKDQAKALMEKAGVPVVPGYHGERQDPKFLKEKAYEIGYPVLIKAVAGGGGKGMRRVDKHAEFDAALEGAQREAQSAFGDARVLIEKYVTAPRHIEMQVFADSARQCHPSERARLLAAAPPSEGDRGGARARHDRGGARRHGPRRDRGRARGRLSGRRHGRVHRRRRAAGCGPTASGSWK